APAIDASGELMDGTKVTGPTELRAALLRQPDVFVQTVTEKLLIYAIGRGLDPADMPTVRTIVRDAKAADYRFASLVLGIVKSVPFQMRVASPSAGESRAALSLPVGARLEHTGADSHVHH